MSRDFNNDFNLDFGNNLSRDFNNDFGRDFSITQSENSFKHFNNDFSNDFLSVSSGDFSNDFSNDFSASRGLKVIEIDLLEYQLSLQNPKITKIFNLSSLTYGLDFNNPTFRVVTLYAIGPFEEQAYDLKLYEPRLDKGVNILTPLLEYKVDINTDVRVFNLRTIKFSGTPAPIEHVEDSKRLIADAYIDLFEITLNDQLTKIYLKNNEDRTWGGNTYQGTGIKISGVATYSDDQTSRPTLAILNPDGIYSYLVDKGLLDNATVTRIRLLKTHLDTDAPIYTSKSWRVSRITSLRREGLTLQLRDMLDGQFFLTPGRMFIPPEFPQVSLQ